MGAAGTSNEAGGSSGIASAFSSIYNTFEKFCCEFLRQEIVQALLKLIVQVFSQVNFWAKVIAVLAMIQTGVPILKTISLAFCELRAGK